MPRVGVNVSVDVKGGDKLRGLGGNLNTATNKAGGFKSSLGGITSNLTKMVGPAAAAGAALGGIFAAKGILDGALDLEQATVKLRTQLGLSEEDAAAVENQAKDMAGVYGVAATESVNAGFAIQSAGLRGADAAEALEAATKGAAVGLGEARDIGLLSAAAMTAWSSEGLSATRSTEILAAAVKAGNLDAAELSGSLGQALAPASSLGVSFEELAGSVAFYTKLGVGASEATSAVRQVMNTMLKPSSQASEILGELGFTTESLQEKDWQRRSCGHASITAWPIRGGRRGIRQDHW